MRAWLVKNGFVEILLCEERARCQTKANDDHIYTSFICCKDKYQDGASKSIVESLVEGAHYHTPYSRAHISSGTNAWAENVTHEYELWMRANVVFIRKQFHMSSTVDEATENNAKHHNIFIYVHEL